MCRRKGRVILFSLAGGELWTRCQEIHSPLPGSAQDTRVSRLGQRHMQPRLFPDGRSILHTQTSRLAPRRGTCHSLCVYLCAVISPSIVPGVYCTGFNCSISFMLNQTIKVAVLFTCFPEQWGAGSWVDEQSRGVRRLALSFGLLCRGTDPAQLRTPCQLCLRHCWLQCTSSQLDTGFQNCGKDVPAGIAKQRHIQ